jgi:hypothetical protein
VHRQVAIDRRHALEAVRRVRRHSRHDALEGQRARLRADDVEVGRLRDQAGVERGVALQRGEGAEAAVLLGGDRGEHDLRAGAVERGERVQRGDDRALHIDAAAAVQPAVLLAAVRVRPRHGAVRHDVDVPGHGKPAAVAVAARGHRQPP